MRWSLRGFDSPRTSGIIDIDRSEIDSLDRYRQFRYRQLRQIQIVQILIAQIDIEGCIDKQMWFFSYSWIYLQRDRNIDGQIDICKYGQLDGYIDRQIDRNMERKIDRYMERQIDRQVYGKTLNITTEECGHLPYETNRIVQVKIKDRNITL